MQIYKFCVFYVAACFDLASSSQCQSWSRGGTCRFHAFVQRYCRRTCRRCWRFVSIFVDFCLWTQSLGSLSLYNALWPLRKESGCIEAKLGGSVSRTAAVCCDRVHYYYQFLRSLNFTIPIITFQPMEEVNRHDSLLLLKNAVTYFFIA